MLMRSITEKSSATIRRRGDFARGKVMVARSVGRSRRDRSRCPPVMWCGCLVATRKAKHRSRIERPTLRGTTEGMTARRDLPESVTSTAGCPVSPGVQSLVWGFKTRVGCSPVATLVDCTCLASGLLAGGEYLLVAMRSQHHPRHIPQVSPNRMKAVPRVVFSKKRKTPQVFILAGFAF